MNKDESILPSAIRDMITDILHYAEQKKLNISKLVTGALEVFKEEKFQKEAEQGCMIKVTTEDDDIYLCKITSSKFCMDKVFPMTDEGISDLKVELKDYGCTEEAILEAVENGIIFANINESVLV
jgi:hypothetical protein